MASSEKEVVAVPERAAAINKLAEAIADQKIAVEEVPQAINRLSEAVEKDTIQRQRQARRQLFGTIVVIVGIVVLLWVGWTTHKVLAVIQNATGNEAQERSKRSIDTILTQIDARDRESNQRLLDEVAKLLDKPSPGPVLLPQTPSAPPVPAVRPTTTSSTPHRTTTTAAGTSAPAHPAPGPSTTTQQATTTSTLQHCDVQAGPVCVTRP
jgi:cytoskeletal protein RodZ